MEDVTRFSDRRELDGAGEGEVGWKGCEEGESVESHLARAAGSTGHCSRPEPRSGCPIGASVGCVREVRGLSLKLTIAMVK